MKRTTRLPEVPREKYGIRVLVRERPDNRGGNLELVACVPYVDTTGKAQEHRRRRSAGTTDPSIAYRRAEALAQRLALRLQGLVQGRIRSRFFSGDDITDLDCLDYYETEVISKLDESSEYRSFAESKIKVLRRLLPAVAENGRETPLRLIEQGYVDRLVALRLEKGALRKDGTGEWKEYGEMDEDDRKVRLRTVETDILVLRRAINAAKSYQVKDAEGKWLSAIQYDPFLDATKRIKLPKETDIRRQPIMDYDAFEKMISAAGGWDRHSNAEYSRLKYPERFPHHRPRCPGYSEALLKVARQGRRRGDFPRLKWRHVVFPENSKRMAEVILKVLAVKVTPEQARQIFPHGLLIWSRGKTDVYRFAPMPQYLCESLRRFEVEHPHRDNPDGPLFYAIRDHRKAATQKNLASWFPKIQAWAGIDHGDEEGWHMFRRLFRQERIGHFTNKIVAYCGGWSRLNAISKLLDVDESQAMNRHYLQVLLRQMYACMAFDASRIDARVHIAGVSDHVLAQLREEGYLADSSGTPMDVVAD